ncbi:oncostatin-M-specific receptor subunit beta-like isoform X3 [Pezoporus wallicus]|uniref:oncostatin-M-specific receptor subunit beta-like isoform X3 n=1 Tax=Pezoporus wallicus TaxID=35540 RepID=UPI00254B9710|nr:oncostatin-M-specific receptor subunit beta-like isoform X3 [Pezoporus wallicus]
MMNHFMVLAVLLPLRTCYTTYSQEESIVFPVTYLNISKDLALQRLLMEWDVGKSAHDAELAMSFEIQVRRTDEASTMWTEFHNTTLDKSGKPLHWIWDSDIPLECMAHSVRIRSKAEASKIWSQWSLWETVLGLDTSNSSGPQIFPNEKIVEEGSDITLCCIGRKGQILKEFFLAPAVHVFSHTDSQVRLLTVKNVSHQGVPHITVYCQESCDKEQCYDHAVFFVGKSPDAPANFSCQTQDMRTVTCTWSQGGDTYLYGCHSPKYTLYEEFSHEKVPCTVSCSEQCSCSWDIGQQRILNITVTVENPLGKKTATDVFDVTHRIYPAAPSQLWEECTDTKITLYWKHQNKGIELFCQTEVLLPDGKVELHNSSDTHLHYASQSIMLDGLQPYTEYTTRVHCGAAKHFWKWSEWSEARTIRTNEAIPSGKLDIWREITPVRGGRNVTLLWKQAPSFQANGENISYEVTWGKVEDGSKSESFSFSSVYNSTRISIDNHSYRISITAKNNVNYSLPSVLIIPSTTDTEELKEEQVNGTDDGIFITWEPRHMYDNYIVDWCNFPMLQPCDLQWKRFGPNASSALINSAAFIPGVRYNFEIYGSVANKASLLEKKTGFLRELPPILDPVVEKVELTFNAVTLCWDSYPTNESQPGFVRGYHVYVSPLQEDCSLKGSQKHVLPANVLYLLFLLVIVPALAAAICRWRMKWVKECCCPVIPSPNKSKVLSFKEFKIGSEKVLKINDCIPDMLAVDSKAEAQKLHPWSQLSSMTTDDKIDDHNSSRIYLNENEERDFTPTPTPQTHTWFENFAYSSHLAVESDLYQLPETIEASKPELSVMLYQPHLYFDIVRKILPQHPEKQLAERPT